MHQHFNVFLLLENTGKEFEKISLTPSLPTLHLPYPGFYCVCFSSFHFNGPFIYTKICNIILSNFLEFSKWILPCHKVFYPLILVWALLSLSLCITWSVTCHNWTLRHVGNLACINPLIPRSSPGWSRVFEGETARRPIQMLIRDNKE